MASLGHLESTVGAVYEGPKDMNGKWSGKGVLKYNTGVFFSGTFYDGEFHGEGVITYPNGAVYRSVWHHGKEEEGCSSYQWDDGLPFNLYQDWEYLAGHDRRLWSEHQAGPGKRAVVDYSRSKRHTQTNHTASVVDNIPDADILNAVQGLVRVKSARTSER